MLERWAKWIKRNKLVAGACHRGAGAAGGDGRLARFRPEAQKQAEEATRKRQEADEAVTRQREETLRADRERDDAIFGATN